MTCVPRLDLEDLPPWSRVSFRLDLDSLRAMRKLVVMHTWKLKLVALGEICVRGSLCDRAPSRRQRLSAVDFHREYLIFNTG